MLQWTLRTWFSDMIQKVQISLKFKSVSSDDTSKLMILHTGRHWLFKLIHNIKQCALLWSQKIKEIRPRGAIIVAYRTWNIIRPRVPGSPRHTAGLFEGPIVHPLLRSIIPFPWWRMRPTASLPLQPPYASWFPPPLSRVQGAACPSMQHS